MQCASIVATAVLYMNISVSTSWLSLVYGLGFSHYALALLYSTRAARPVLTQPHSLAALGVVIAAGTYLYLNVFPLYIYFGVHHVFNEVYMRRRLIPGELNTVALRISAVVLHVIAYFLLLRAQAIAASGYLPLVLAGLVAAVGVYVSTLVRGRRALSISRWIDLTAFEVIVLALVPVAFVYPFTLEQVVCYHFIFWILYPLRRLTGSGLGRALGVYLILTMASIGVFLLISPLGPLTLRVPVRSFVDQFILWSYVHITLSFALSAAHPDWITRWFRPRAAPATT